MKKILTFLILAIFSESSAALNIEIPSAKHCNQPPLGPPGPQGPQGPAGPPGSTDQTTAFGSYYNSVSVEVLDGDPIPFPTTLSSLNIDHPNDTDFNILQSAYYLINFGAEKLVGDPGAARASIFVNGVEVAGSRTLVINETFMSSTALVIPLNAGSLVQVVITNSDVILQTEDLEAVNAFLTLTRLLPL